MPHSLHRSLARERAAYTGESPACAATGTTRSGTLGLDECTPAQRQLRALLALAVFNYGPDAEWLTDTALAELSLYTFTISPQPDRLVIISDAHDNIGNRLLPGWHKATVLCLPGMRVLDYRGDWLHMLHLPTGAEIVTTRRRNGTSDRPSLDELSWWRLDQPLTEQEAETLRPLPAMTPDAEALLAAVLVRMWLRSADGRWEIAGWFNRPAARRNDRTRDCSYRRQLDGAGDNWRLTWKSWPHPDDLAAALTHPRAGLHGVAAEPADTGYKLRFGTATLLLVP